MKRIIFLIAVVITLFSCESDGQIPSIGGMQKPLAIEVGGGGEMQECISAVLYNWYAATDSRNIAASGAHVPTRAEMQAFRAYIASQGWNYDGTTDAGTDMANKQVKAIVKDVSYWDSYTVDGAPGNNIYETYRNITGFSARPTGTRAWLGNFLNINYGSYFWTSDAKDYDEGYALDIYSNNASFQITDPFKRYGYSIRLIIDNTTLSDGEMGTYTGNDGKTYNTICINGVEWTENLEETKYRNLDDITYTEDATTWHNATSGAWCYYNNDSSYSCK